MGCWSREFEAHFQENILGTSCNYVSIKYWRHCLFHKEFISLIDHKSLKYINSQATLYHKHARWMFLQNYIFLVQHKRVKSNLVVDAFGRRHHLLVTMTSESVGFEALKDSYDAND
jgi:hypothetical protein